MRKRIVSGLLVVCLGIAAFAVVVAAQAAENSAKGSLTVDGQPVRLTHVYAYARPGFFDKKKRDVVVLICDAPVAAKAVRDVFELKKLTDTGRLHCVSQTINTEGQVINYDVMHNRFGMQESGGSTSHVFEAKTFGVGTIEGRSRTTSTQKSFRDVPYSYDVTFAAAIEPMPDRKAGKKLPAGGGALGKAYLAKVKSTLNMDIAEIRRSAPPGELDNTSDQELRAMLQLAVALTPKDQKITDGYENGDQGTLFVTGMLGQERRYGVIGMEKKDGEWVVADESWSDTPPE